MTTGAALLALALAVAAVAGQDALVDEDVVRMVAAGRPEAEIVRLIDEGDVRFDLSEEMIDELRLAGVSERVLDAMRARQTQLHPPAAPQAPAAAVADELASVQVSFVPARAGEPAIWIPAVAGDDLARALELSRSEKDRKIDGIAIFVACTRADHVPDQWRTRSPLGHDFVSMPRHEMLQFHASSVRVAQKDVPRSLRSSTAARAGGAVPEWLRLDLPAELSVRLRPGTTHDLVAGVAVLVGENYLAIGLDEVKEIAPESASGGVHTSIGRGEGRSAVEVRFLPSLDGVQPPR